MVNILLAACYFPPAAVGGVYRSAKFAKYLSAKGYKVFVLTKNWDNSKVPDDTLLDFENENLHVIRVDGAEKYLLNVKNKDEGNPFKKENKIVKCLKSIVKNTLLNLVLPDIYILWNRPAYQKACRIIEENNIDVVFTTGNPFSTHLLGLKLKKKFRKIKWLADFRDPWATNPINDQKKLLHIIEKSMEKSVVVSCDKLIFTTEGMKGLYFNEYGKYIAEDKIKVVNNGADIEDFNKYNNMKLRKSKKFTISYVGALYHQFRDPSLFFRGIRKAIEKLDYTEDIIVEFIGNKYLEFDEIVSKYCLEKYIYNIHHLSHDEAVFKMIGADLLLLIEGRYESSKYLIAGKLYEYIMSNTPVLALIGEGENYNIIKNEDAGYVVTGFDEEEIADIIVSEYNRWKCESEEKIFVLKKERYYKYSREYSAGQLIHIINENQI